MTILWTERAQADLAAIHAFIEADSTHYATVTVRRLLGAVAVCRISRTLVMPCQSSVIRKCARSSSVPIESSTESSVQARFTC